MSHLKHLIKVRKRSMILPAGFYPSLLSILLLASCSTTPSKSLTETNTEKSTLSFELLYDQKTARHFEWRNPKGIKESIDFFVMSIPITPQIKRHAIDYLKDVFPEEKPEALLQVDPRMMVIHSMSQGTLRDGVIASGFLEEELTWTIPQGWKWGVGSHFMIDLDGTIYCLAPPSDASGAIDFTGASRFPVKHHVKEVDPWAIGIENIVPAVSGAMNLPEPEMQKVFGNLTPAQLKANVKLAAFLVSRYPQIRYVFGHNQFVSEEFVEALKKNKFLMPTSLNPKARTSNRADPGDPFINQVLRALKRTGVNLSNAPER